LAKKIANTTTSNPRINKDVTVSFRIATARNVADKGVRTMYIVARDGPKRERLQANNPNWIGTPIVPKISK
jgi:hypothetical protein